MVEIPLNPRGFVFKGVRQRTVTRKIGLGNQHVRRKSRSQPVKQSWLVDYSRFTPKQAERFDVGTAVGSGMEARHVPPLPTSSSIVWSSRKIPLAEEHKTSLIPLGFRKVCAGELLLAAQSTRNEH
jgi:hypothetical protein